MMLPSHVFSGMILALPLVVVAPEFATVGLVAGFLGGLFPDLDLYAGHRKTLHYPVYYSVLAAGAVLVALLVPSPTTIAVTFFLLGAAVHCVADIFGGGLELRPWEGTSERAVYDHFHGRWIPPRRVIRYDGALEDLLLSTVLAVPLFVLVDGPLRFVVIGTLLVGCTYTVLRRRLATVATVLVRFLPAAVVPYLPSRYVVDDRVR
ncbi:metal-dependent hydrolase [Natronorubrum sp. JWXQ-INN-674]|uniref:Metal-dependent hydrolase n=1 Tax=Natronorubrum halalkaliphilum TaxID=2691917 RepID=A0A6B0VQV5_9EURY|nr:metal-dependent hydrolase [Natronorubrum halalkaliphilum]MXV63447.1 metal-dependent hydrolase [Natronorubrum halalkaliphilum]